MADHGNRREDLHSATYLSKVILPRRQIYNHIRMQDTLIASNGDTSGYSDRQLHTLRFNNASADRDRAQLDLGMPVDDE
jgi:hypothetical protein